jgi:2'-5' RNA ligase
MSFSYWIALISVVLLTGCASKPSSPGHHFQTSPISYEKDLFQVRPFVARVPTSQKSAAYLGMDLNHEAFSRVREDVEKKIERKLLHRDESHITVITPPEFTEVLSKHLTMKDIESLAAKMKLQEAAFKPTCIGRGQTLIDGKQEQTYYVVVHADRLFHIRRAIRDLYVKKGGQAKRFEPDAFYPHITLGFTKRDLHLQDGVIKDESSCVYAMTAQ